MKASPKAAADVLARAKPRSARVRLVLDGELLDRLEAELEGLDPTSAKARKLEQQVVAAETEFVFKGMGRGRWRKLVAANPPTDEQKTRGADFDVDEFPFLAMAECLISPALSVDDLKRLNDEVLDESQFDQLWNACLVVNIGVRRRAR